MDIYYLWLFQSQLISQTTSILKIELALVILLWSRNLGLVIDCWYVVCTWPVNLVFIVISLEVFKSRANLYFKCWLICHFEHCFLSQFIKSLKNKWFLKYWILKKPLMRPWSYINDQPLTLTFIINYITGKWKNQMY